MRPPRKFITETMFHHNKSFVKPYILSGFTKLTASTNLSNLLVWSCGGFAGARALTLQGIVACSPV